jgi:hypothetical protein
MDNHEQNRQLREQYEQVLTEFAGYQQMLAALASRHGGALVFDPAELAEVPVCFSLVASKDPGGWFVVRLVSGEPGQPGSAG